MTDNDTYQQQDDPEPQGVKVYFNPFAFTMEENNEFLAKGYEPMFIKVAEYRG